MFPTGASSPPQIFQTYLLPAFSFRRRKSSTDTFSTNGSFSSTSSSSFSSSPTTPGAMSSMNCFPASALPIPQQQPSTYLSGATSHISCSRCHADLALTSQIISKGFTGRHGRAYLVAGSSSPLATSPSSAGGIGNAHTGLPNTHTHKPMPRHLVTGLHTVCDISCAMCGSVLGWKYVNAEEDSQRYKVGKFILETRRVTVGSCWETDECDEEDADGRARPGAEDDVTFDSQDEDECEDLFAGIWTPQLARKRRGRRVSLQPAT